MKHHLKAAVTAIAASLLLPAAPTASAGKGPSKPDATCRDGDVAGMRTTVETSNFNRSGNIPSYVTVSSTGKDGLSINFDMGTDVSLPHGVKKDIARQQRARQAFSPLLEEARQKCAKGYTGTITRREIKGIYFSYPLPPPREMY